jgi:hypothetical protein
MANQDLGSVLAIYRGRSIGFRDVFLKFLPPSLVVFSLFGYGLWSTYYGYTQYGPIAAVYWGRPWFIAAAIVSIPLLLLILYRLFISLRRIDVHENGLRLRINPFISRTLFWSQLIGISAFRIDEDFAGKPVRKRQRLVLYPNRRWPIHIDERLVDSQSLAEWIKHQFYPCLLSSLQDRLHKGERLKFGKISIHKDYIRWGARKIAWERVSSLRFQAGHVVVELGGNRRLRMAAQKIINLELLLRLVDTGINRPER